MQGLALIGAGGLLLVGVGCRDGRGAGPEFVPDPWSSPVTTSASPMMVPEPSVQANAFFLESPGILDQWKPSTMPCKTSRTPDSVLFLGHYPPASLRLLSTIEAWSACTQRVVKHVVILSPDHYQRLETGFATTNQSYRVRSQTLPSNESYVHRLKEAGAVSSALFTQEHGVGVPLALVSAYWPQLESVTAIVVSRKIAEGDARTLARELRIIADQPDTLVVVSVDFSHGLAREEARSMDRQTRQALQHRQRSFFWSAQDANVDFGRGVWVMLGLLGSQGSVHIDQAFDSIDIGGASPTVTTFFSGWLTKD